MVGAVTCSNHAGDKSNRDFRTIKPAAAQIGATKKPPKQKGDPQKPQSSLGETKRRPALPPISHETDAEEPRRDPAAINKRG
jgi:hypothetical protein